MKRLLFFLLSITAATLAYAQVPGTLSYQGILVNVAGNPVADGNHTVTFNFHKTATGGVPTFARGPFTVSTYKGLFTLVLGTGTPATANDPLPVLASDPNYIGNTQYYLELVADNVILSPRVSLSSMPYAFTAQNANVVTDGNINGSTTINTTGNITTTGNAIFKNAVGLGSTPDYGTSGQVLTSQGTGTAPSWTTLSGSSTGWGLSGNAGTAGTSFLGTTDNQPLIFSTNTTGGGGERMRIGADGKVGIGTTSTLPLGRLDVSGGPIVFGGTLNNSSPRPALTSTPINNEIWAYNSVISTADDGFLRITAGGGSGAGAKSFIDLSGFSTVADMNANITFGTAGAEKMRIDIGGNLGIGTNIPASKLDVAGDVRLAQTTAPTTTTDKLYNVGGNLYWNGGKLFNGFSNSNGNTFFGYDAGKANTTGSSNHFVGFGAGRSNTTGTENHFEGLVAGADNTTGSFNHFSGDGAGRKNTTASFNQFVGVYAGNNNTTGASNHFSGYSAGGENTTGSNNHFVGFHAGQFNTTASENHFEGYLAGQTNTTGTPNHFVGFRAGTANTTGAGNYFSGYNAGNANTTGSQNHFVGFYAGSLNTTANENHFEGYLAGRSNTTGAANLFIGSQAGRDNTTANENHFVGEYSGLVNTTGQRNYFSGLGAGNANTTASENHFEGYKAGYFNTVGAANYFSGYLAGWSNITGSNNHFSGYQAGTANTIGGNNVFVGYQAGLLNTTGSANTVEGSHSFTANTTGGGNATFGNNALENNTTGFNNLALGGSSMNTNTTGSNNTIVGTSADVGSSNLSNATALGTGAIVNASNKIRLGNSGVTVIEGQVAFTAASDRRLKTNIQDLDAGLDFILKLKPVSYYMKNQTEPRTNWGFIAQEIESLVGSNNSILTIGGDNDRTLGLRYTDFIAPMVKAIQEQQKTIDTQQEKIKELENKISKLNNTLTAELDAIKKQLGMEVKAESTPVSSGGHK